jgi:hypothetical protein
MKPRTSARCLIRCRLGVVALVGVLVVAAAGRAASAEYLNHKDLTARIKKLAAGHRRLVRVESLAESPGKRDVWLVELGTGSDDARKPRPAMLVAAGLEGNDLAGSASVLAWIEQLAENYEKDETVRKLLDSTTLYALPRLNGDAAERFFATPRLESATSNRPTDDDRDGLVDEDGPDDLNGDGIITQMRVEDPEGEYVLDPAEPRLLIKADRTKGERGTHRLFTEGRDDDRDERWNEDGLGGVNLNRNFPFGYKFFAPDAGRHQVSETETRALADLLVAHPSIGIVFAFGATDLLTSPPKSEAPKRPPTAIHDDDIGFYRELGRAWRDALGLKKELAGASEAGTLADWVYFHRGRLALSARAWSPALQLELAKGKPKPDDEKTKPAADKPKDEKPADAAKPDEKKKPEGDSRGEEDRAFLKWLDEHAPGAFVPWKAHEHPDFPGRKVEIGGFAPFARTVPPEKMLGDLTARHAKFLTTLAGRLPRVAVRKAEAKALGNAVYDLTLQIENTGYLPTALAQGGVTREVFPTRVVFPLEAAAFLNGARQTLLGPIAGSGGMREVRVVVHAKGRKRIEFEVVSMLAGSIQSSVELKEESNR